MMIRRYSLGSLQANCYLITHDKDCLIIDPADEAGFLLEEITRQNLSLRAMVATHGHFDHCMAAGEIQHSFPVPLYLHAKDAFLVKRLGATAKHFLGYEPYTIAPKFIAPLKEGDLRVGPFSLQVIGTPGHTPGGCSLYLPEEQCVFTGDTLFAGSIGRTDLSYSRPLDLSVSLKKLLSLPEETVIYPGHGDETSVLNEKDSYSTL